MSETVISGVFFLRAVVALAGKAEDTRENRASQKPKDFKSLARGQSAVFNYSLDSTEESLHYYWCNVLSVSY